jgi:hypothetical protein
MHLVVFPINQTQASTNFLVKQYKHHTIPRLYFPVHYLENIHMASTQTSQVRTPVSSIVVGYRLLVQNTETLSFNGIAAAAE